MNTNEYSEYTVPLTDDPSAYGPNCTENDAKIYTDWMVKTLEQEFPGINVEVHHQMIGSFSVRGPDSKVCDEITALVRENWTAAM